MCGLMLGTLRSLQVVRNFHVHPNILVELNVTASDKSGQVVKSASVYRAEPTDRNWP